MNPPSENLDILIIDKDKNLLEEYKNFFQKNNLSVQSAETISGSTETIVMYNPYVILVDTVSTGMGNELLRSLRKIGIESQIIIHSKEMTEDIQYKKQTGLCFSFLKKGENIKNELLSHVLVAKESSIKLQNLNAKIREEDETHKRELDWLLWQQRKSQNSKHALGRTILETLSHSIFQGMGIGAALSIIELIELTREDDGKYSKIKTDLLDSLLENVEPMRLIKEKLDQLIKLLDKEYDKEIINCDTIQNIISDSIQKTEEFRKIKNQKIVRSNFTYSKQVFANKEFLGICIREVLINAFKYSPDNSRILIVRGHSENGLSLLFINSISNVTKGVRGVPQEYENQVFEPFFRINRIYDERFYLEELGFGVGLSILHKGLTSMGGNIFVYEAIDHASSVEPEKKIVAEIVLLNAET